MSSSYGSLWPGAPASAKIVKSQNVYATATTPLTVIGSGGGGSSDNPNPTFSTITMADNTATQGIIYMTNGDAIGYGSVLRFNYDNTGVFSADLGYESSTSSLRVLTNTSGGVANGNLYVERLQGLSSLNAYPIPSYPMAINASTLSLNVQTTDFTNNALVNVSTINGTSWAAVVSTVAGLPR